MSEKETLSMVTEVGVFGKLDIEDPTVTEATRKQNQEDIDKMISEAVTENAHISI